MRGERATVSDKNKKISKGLKSALEFDIARSETGSKIIYKMAKELVKSAPMDIQARHSIATKRVR